VPSRPLSADRSAVVKLHTRLDVEAIDMVKHRPDLPAAVARLALLVPAARVDLVDDVLAAVGRSIPGHRTAWPPPERRYELAYQVKRVHAGEVMLRGPNGEVVEVIAYRDKLGYDRKVYRLSRHGVFIGEYKTPEELGGAVGLADLVEDDGRQGWSGNEARA
jgi:hypothetical protein